MTTIPVHSQDLTTGAYSRLAKNLYKSHPEIGSYSLALELLAKVFGYKDHKQVTVLASYVPWIEKEPEDYIQDVKSNISELGCIDFSLLDVNNFKWLVSFGCHIKPIVNLDKRTINVLCKFYFRSILDTYEEIEDSRFGYKSYRSLISQRLSSLGDDEQVSALEIEIPEFFCKNHSYRGYNDLPEDFEQLHRANCLAAITEATQDLRLFQYYGVKTEHTDMKCQIYKSMTVDSVFRELCEGILLRLCNKKLRALNFFYVNVDYSPIKLGSLGLEDKKTQAALKKEYAQARKNAKLDYLPKSFDEFVKDFDQDEFSTELDLKEEYSSYIAYNKEELAEELDGLHETYGDNIELKSISKKKRHGKHQLIFNLHELSGDGDIGCIIPYSWHCSMRTDGAEIVSIASGHIYDANYNYRSDISDIFLFEENFTRSSGRFASSFQRKIEELQGIDSDGWMKPDISKYQNQGPIVFLEHFYRDLGDISKPGDGITTLRFAAECIVKFFDEDILFVCFVDPPKYACSVKSQPSFVRYQQKLDVQNIQKHIKSGLLDHCVEIYDIIFVGPEHM